jgi:hypothetical protein
MFEPEPKHTRENRMIVTVVLVILVVLVGLGYWFFLRR